MNTKLTLRMDEDLVRKAKQHAARRGKSVSQMVGEFIALLETKKRTQDLPPLTASLAGIMKCRRISEKDYKKHLVEKYL